MVFNPLNGIAQKVVLTEVSPTTGLVTAIDSGTVTAFLAATKTAVVAADVTLNCTVNYSNSPTVLGWVVTLGASVLTKALLDSLFGATGKAYLIVMRTGSIWACIELEYEGEAALMEAA